jgi:hypothetical protein
MKKYCVLFIALMTYFNCLSQNITYDEAVQIAKQNNKQAGYVIDGSSNPVFIFDYCTESENSNGNIELELVNATQIGEFGTQMPGPVYYSWNGWASSVVSHGGGGSGESISYWVTCVPDIAYCFNLFFN